MYIPKILFTLATIDCLAINETEIALHSEMVISNYIGIDPITRSPSDLPFVNVL